MICTGVTLVERLDTLWIYITVPNVYIILKFRICLLPVVCTVKDASELSTSFKKDLSKYDTLFDAPKSVQNIEFHARPLQLQITLCFRQNWNFKFS